MLSADALTHAPCCWGNGRHVPHGAHLLQVHVVEGKEPAHFVSLWAGTMVVYEGGTASGGKTVKDDDAAAESEAAPRLFRVHGGEQAAPRAVQVAARAASLNSGTLFCSMKKILLYKVGTGVSLHMSTQHVVKHSFVPGKLVSGLWPSRAGDAFVAVTPKQAFVWRGGACLPAEVEAASKVLDVILAGAADREVVAVEEGDEPDAFWEALGGQGTRARS
jgi:hypothetical protein